MNTNLDSADPGVVSDPSDVSRSRTPIISSATLLADRRLIHIQHRGEVYALRETRLGKLILTK